MENLNEDQLTNMDLEMDLEARLQLNEAAKWSKFIAIVMFVACGLILMFGIAGGAALTGVLKKLGGTYQALEGFEGAILIVIIVFAVAVLALIYYFLFNFSQKIKAALLSENTADFNTGLKSLKIFFIISTVFAILGLLNNVYNLFF
jgi:hypothetical protein